MFLNSKVHISELHHFYIVPLQNNFESRYCHVILGKSLSYGILTPKFLFKIIHFDQHERCTTPHWNLNLLVLRNLLYSLRACEILVFMKHVLLIESARR